MTTDAKRLAAIAADLERLLPKIDVDMEDGDAAEVYRQFCTLGALLAPAIGNYLAHQGLSQVPEAHPKNLPDLHWGNDTPDSVRRYNTHVVSRLLYDLKPAIASAFHSPAKTVELLVRDLSFENPPVALPAPTKRTAGAGGRQNRDLRKAARRLIYEVVLFEKARLGKGAEAVLKEMTAGVFSLDNWKRLERELGKSVDKRSFEAAGKNALAPHPKSNQISARLAHLALS